MSGFTYLSVCSGIEAASVAFHPLGWTPKGFAEIEKFPCQVLAHHYGSNMPGEPLATNGVPNYGDFTQLIDAPIDVDMLVGGTPCQAFSVAGLRNSLADARGNLTLAYVRLANAIDDLRHSRGKQPAVLLWENVPGVLNTKDNAFGAFLGGLAGADAALVPADKRGRWTNAGVVAGPARTVAWRVLDAQYFGLAQRRKRVFVVASARKDFDPAAVFLEPAGVRRHPPARGEAGQGSAHATAPSLTASGRGVERTGESRGQDPVVEVPAVAGALDTQCGGGKLTHQSLTNGHVIGTITARMFAALGTRDVEEGAVIPTYLDPLNQSTSDDVAKTLAARADMDGMGVVCTTGEVTHTLKAEGFDGGEDGTGRGTPIVPTYTIRADAMREGVAKTPSADAEGRVRLRDPGMGVYEDLAPTLDTGAAHGVVHATAYRTTGNNGVYETGKIVDALTTATDPNSHVVAFTAKDYGGDATAGLSPTLRSMGHADSHANGGGQIGVAYAIQAGATRENPASGPDGVGVQADHAYTLEARAEVQAVAFAQNSRDEVRMQGGDGQIVGALAAEPGMKQTTYVATVEPYTLAIRGRGGEPALEARQDGTANALLTPNGGRAGIGVGAVAHQMAVRRLTPRECERLQGFPDDYTLIQIGKKTAADGPRYKALGNSMAVPCMRWIGERINQQLEAK